MLEYARVRSSMLECVRACSSMLECAPVCSSMLEDDRVCTNMLEYAGLALQCIAAVHGITCSVDYIVTLLFVHTRACSLVPIQYSRIHVHTRAYCSRACSRIPAHTRAYSRILAHAAAYPRKLAHTRAYSRIPGTIRDHKLQSCFPATVESFAITFSFVCRTIRVGFETTSNDTPES